MFNFSVYFNFMVGKKNKINLKELDELNIIHNMLNNISEINPNPNINNQYNLSEDIKNIIQSNVLEGLDSLIIKKKRGRKKKVDILNKIPYSDLSLELKENMNKSILESNIKSIIKVKSKEKTNSNINLIEKTQEIKTKSIDKLTDSDENNNGVLKELLVKQLKNICSSKKLLFGDIKRISKFLNETIFDESKCSLWHGYITNEKNQSKGTYINFYFNKKKIALHRLLYINFVGDISNEEYVKFSCENKGKCCCIHHMKKYSYNKSIEEYNSIRENNFNQSNQQKNTINTSTSNQNDVNNIHINRNKDKLVVEF